MALDLGTVLAVVEVVRKCMAMYERIESLPKQMAQMGRRIKRLSIYLGDLEAFVMAKPTTAFAALYSGQRAALVEVLASIQGNVAKVHDVFDRYEKGILSRSKNLEFRAKWLSSIWFSLVDSSPGKVQTIMEEIDQDAVELRDWLDFMTLKGVQVLVQASWSPDTPPLDRGRDRGRGTDETAATTQRAVPSPSPSPAPPRRDYKILFVDPYNTARGVVAEALVKLFGQLTVKNGGDWRISEVESVGFFVKSKSDCISTIDGLDYSFKTFKKPWMEGHESAAKTALAAVFDNKWYDHPFKEVLQQEMASRKSRGLQKDMFTRFDYIVVFTNREHDNMIKLKDAIRRTRGASRASTHGKGRILQLGTFLKQDGGPAREILHPAGVNSDGPRSRQDWNKKVAEIKTALKELLKREMQWKQPESRGKAPAGGQKTLEVGKA